MNNSILMGTTKQ